MFNSFKKPAAAAIALSLGLALSACGGQPTNRSLDSIKQPVVERQNFTLDVRTGGAGLSVPEQQRLTKWFETLDVKYGDRVSIDDPVSSPATKEAIAALAARHGLLIEEGAPVTPGYVEPGMARVVITRTKAYVPGCPDWSEQLTFNYNNGTNNGFGCAVNGNLAAMVANPEHLIKGAEGTGETVVMSSNKAIQSYQDQSPSGSGSLPGVATN
jgi:pilus assembly protein CpaD